MGNNIQQLWNNDSRYSLYNLITILFAVVIGFGAQEFTKVLKMDTFDMVYCLELATAIIAILLSYYGYNFGIVHGPKENSFYLYFVNVLILSAYFYLVSFKENKIVAYAVIFLLYYIWERIRLRRSSKHEEHDVLRSAMEVNLAFLIAFIELIIIDMYTLVARGYLAVASLILIIFYRIIIHSSYTLNDDIEKLSPKLPPNNVHNNYFHFIATVSPSTKQVGTC